jgi:trk/ktr system potassium uptake protein
MTGNLPTGQPLPGPPRGPGPGIRFSLPGNLARLVLTLLAAAVVVFEYGFFIPPAPVWAMRLVQCLALLGYGLDLERRRRRGGDPFAPPRGSWLEFGLLALALIGLVMSLARGGRPYWHLVEAVSVGLFLVESWRLNVVLSRALARPGLLLPMSFALLILIGTPLLMAPRATPHVFDPSLDAFVPVGERISFGEALFTATSAVCVTGLTVRDTAREFTPFGQAVIGALIQLGGLGIIIFGSMLVTLLGQSLSLKENLNLRDMLNDQPMHKLRGFVRFIVLTTIGIELIGAAVLYPLWDDPVSGPLTAGQRVGMSLFHAVSAFCNAGFDITGHSLVGYRHALLTHAVIVPLIVVGGLGFPALENLLGVARARVSRWLRYQPVRPGAPTDLTAGRLSLHTKVVLTATACLYLWGVVTIGAGQLMPYLQESMQQGVTAHVDRPEPLTVAGLGGLLADASFMSVTARTAGFNAMPMDELQPAGRFGVMTLMMVGGSPGSTAGGFKTTVIALLALAVVATIRQRPRAEAFGRTIADSLVRKAATIGLCYLLLVTLSTMLLCLSEPFSFQALAFEAVSASTTTGLSLGITEDLTGFGRAVIIASMFLGRVGPLALLGAMTFSRAADRPYRYAHEAVALG